MPKITAITTATKYVLITTALRANMLYTHTPFKIALLTAHLRTGWPLGQLS